MQSAPQTAAGFYQWDLVPKTEFPSTTSFVQDFKIPHAKLGTSVTSKVETNAVSVGTNAGMTLVPRLEQPGTAERYRHPRLIYTVSLKAGYSTKRTGTVEFSLNCGTESNYLFDLHPPGWSFEFSGVDGILFVGSPLVRWAADRLSVGNRVFVTALQAFATTLANPSFEIRVTPSLVYYQDDPPVPPEPRWYAVASCKMLTYIVQTGKARELERWKREVDESTTSSLECLALDESFEVVSY